MKIMHTHPPRSNVMPSAAWEPHKLHTSLDWALRDVEWSKLIFATRFKFIDSRTMMIKVHHTQIRLISSGNTCFTKLKIYGSMKLPCQNFLSTTELKHTAFNLNELGECIIKQSQAIYSSQTLQTRFWKNKIKNCNLSLFLAIAIIDKIKPSSFPLKLWMHMCRRNVTDPCLLEQALKALLDHMTWNLFHNINSDPKVFSHPVKHIKRHIIFISNIEVHYYISCFFTLSHETLHIFHCRKQPPNRFLP